MAGRTSFLPSVVVQLIIVVVLTVVLSGSLVLAQGDIAEPIGIGENKIAQITETSPVARMTLTVDQPQNALIQVLSMTTGLAPSFSVVDANGIALLNVDNTGMQTVVQGTAPIAAPGSYGILIFSSTGILGQTLVSVQPGAPLEPPQELLAGENAQASVSIQAPVRSYLVAASEEDTTLLTVQSLDSESGPIVVLRNADSGEPLSMTTSQLTGVQLRIPAANTAYQLDISHSGGTEAEQYVVCVDLERAPSACPIRQQTAPQPTLIPTLTALPTATPVPPTTQPLPTLPATGPCVVASATGGPVNVRSGPSTSYSVLGQISGLTTAPIIARLPDNSWFQINFNFTTGWISSTVVRIGGQCPNVPAVTLTPTLPATAPSPTWSPTPTWTTTATATATSEASATWTATPTWTASPTATVTDTPEAVATLNFSLPAVYGSTSLTSGFVPDPFSVGVTGGGPANVNYLGGGCSGYTTSAPSFSVNYTSGAFPTLRFYFIGSGDTTMIINSPSGSYFCVDDSFGTLNPTIDFNSPSSGRYDVWIGTFNAGGSIGGTLYVTESTANHP